MQFPVISHKHKYATGVALSYSEEIKENVRDFFLLHVGMSFQTSSEIKVYFARYKEWGMDVCMYVYFVCSERVQVSKDIKKYLWFTVWFCHFT